MKEPKDITILIVDDDETLREAIAFDFQRKGFKVLMAAGGNEAYRIVEAQAVDIVLSDVRMPDGDGVKLLGDLKRRNQDSPAVMLVTGYADLDLDQAYDMGADAVFAKPFDRKSLINAVARLTMPRPESWAQRPERVSVNEKIELKAQELSLANTGNVLNIGRGGMFVAIEKKFPLVGSIMQFQVTFQDPALSPLEGLGIVRWVRPKNQGNLRAGFGLEFQTLDARSSETLTKFLDSMKTTSFIPKA